MLTRLFNQVKTLGAVSLGLVSILAAPIALSASVSSDRAQGYSDHPKAKAFIEKMVNTHGFERKHVISVLDQAQKKQSILDAISRPAEKTLTWKGYRQIFLKDRRINQGVAFWNEYQAILAQVERDYGVDAGTIVAILGVETRYGKHKGNYRVIDALATLGFDYPPRAKFFAGQFEQFLLMTREQGFEPNTLTGSYAGAMGWGQFIPSSYRHYAVDNDGDKKADIWNNPKDAIASVANYFKEHGWQTGQPVAYEVVPEKGFDAKAANSSRKLNTTVGALAQKGYPIPADELSQGKKGSSVPASAKAMMMRFDGAKGKEYWVGLKNFYVITRYNHSKLYGMAVAQLREAIVKKRNQTK